MLPPTPTDLFNSCRGLACKLARRWTYRHEQRLRAVGLDGDDALSVANMALWYASCAFKSGRDGFSSYCYTVIVNRLTNFGRTIYRRRAPAQMGYDIARFPDHRAHGSVDELEAERKALRAALPMRRAGSGRETAPGRRQKPLLPGGGESPSSARGVRPVVTATWQRNENGHRGQNRWPFAFQG